MQDRAPIAQQESIAVLHQVLRVPNVKRESMEVKWGKHQLLLALTAQRESLVKAD